MRIGFVSTYPPLECGIGTYTEALNNALRKLEHETFVVSPPGTRGDAIFPAWRPDSPSLAMDAFQTSSSLTPDLMHIQHEYGMFGAPKGVKIIELVIRYRLASIPTVITLHTVSDQADQQERVILKHLIEASSGIVVHEEFQKQTLQGWFGAADKIHVIEHGVREVRPVPDAKKKLRLQGKKIVMLCGYYRETKGYHRAIDFFPRIAEQDPDAVLVVAGKVRTNAALDYQRQLVDQLSRSPAADRIIFLRGQFPQYTFDTFLSAADCVLLPYQVGGQSGLLAQCFAHGCPVVCSDLRAFRLLIERSGGGFVCETDEDYVSAILKVLSDAKLRDRMREGMADYIRERTAWSRVAAQHADLYRDLIEPFGKGRYVYIPEPKS